MAKKLRVKVLLNKGKEGVSLHRLPRLLGQIQEFLDSLSEDTVGKRGEWIGIDFYNSSLGYTATSVEDVEDDRASDFEESLKGVVRKSPDAKIRQSTLAQYAKIAEPLTEAETVSFGIGGHADERIDNQSDEGDDTEWFDFNKADALKFAKTGQSFVRSHGGVQGIMHSLFMGSKPPHFQLRELSTRELIYCEYEEAKYPEIVEALEKPRAVLHVYGLIYTDLGKRQIQKLVVSEINIARVLTQHDLDRFIGCAPDLMEPDRLQGFIDQSRNREP